MTGGGQQDLTSRLDRVEQALTHIQELYRKSQHYEDIEPDFSLVQTGRAAEAICKQIWKRMAHEQPEDKLWRRPTDTMTLDDLTGGLERPSRGCCRSTSLPERGRQRSAARHGASPCVGS